MVTRQGASEESGNSWEDARDLVRGQRELLQGVCYEGSKLK